MKTGVFFKGHSLSRKLCTYCGSIKHQLEQSEEKYTGLHHSEGANQLPVCAEAAQLQPSKHLLKQRSVRACAFADGRVCPLLNSFNEHPYDQAYFYVCDEARILQTEQMRDEIKNAKIWMEFLKRRLPRTQ